MSYGQQMGGLKQVKPDEVSLESQQNTADTINFP